MSILRQVRLDEDLAKRLTEQANRRGLDESNYIKFLISCDVEVKLVEEVLSKNTNKRKAPLLKSLVTPIMDPEIGKEFERRKKETGEDYKNTNPNFISFE